jgi:2-phospho-L-lactate guanylyltransferase
MPTVVVPFRSGKTRLALPPEERAELEVAMLARVLAAAVAVGPTLLVTTDAALGKRFGVEVVPDPGGGQGAAVAAGLARVDASSALVVNADLPLATAEDLLELAAAAPALVPAADGTTNALALVDPAAFRPVYGPGSARRFEALGLRPVGLPRLAADVDTVADVAAVGAMAA